MYQLLIVDDEPLVQAGIRSMLNWNEMNIEICGTAMNGQAALKIIEEKSTDIVITDIKMPVMNGLELAKTCRERYGDNCPYFIILTSYEDFQIIGCLVLSGIRLSGKAGTDTGSTEKCHRPGAHTDLPFPEKADVRRKYSSLL